MQKQPNSFMPFNLPTILVAAASLAMFPVLALSQDNPATKNNVKADLKPGRLSVAITFDGAFANTTSLNQFWLKGGAVELTGEANAGLGITASIAGFHTANTGNNIPLSFVAATFGPSYSWTTQVRKHPLTLFGHGLVGEANGFQGLYPATNGAIPSSNSLAVNVGTGADLALKHSFSLRLLEVSWLRTQLPDAANNVQNDLTLAAGIVFHTR